MQSNKHYILCKTIDPQVTNLLFSENYPHLTFNGKAYQRDYLSRYRWITLRKILREHNFFLENDEFFLKKKKKIDFEFHFFSRINTSNKKKYLILPEHEFIDSTCAKKNNLDYTKVFTNIKKDVDNNFFFYLNWPNDFSDNIKTSVKKNFLCLINTNKNLVKFNKKSGYVKRAEIIKWFIKNAPDKLDLYGAGWDNIFSSNHYVNRFYSLLNNRLNLKLKYKNPVFKGFVSDTKNIIKNYKFMISFENLFGFEGYTGNAMMDALNACTVPIYLGRSDISKAVPENCFIDYRKFKNNSDLFKFLNNLSHDEYSNYINNIKNFTSHNHAQECDIYNFAKIILNQLKKDISK